MASGWIMVKKAELLKSLNLPDELEVVGVRWFLGADELKIQLEGDAIPYPGGEIIATDPIQTEKQVRDMEVAKSEAFSLANRLMADAERLP